MQRYIVTTPSLLAVDDSFEDPRFMKVRIDVLESDVEARGHGIRFTRECLEVSKDSFANIPILANVVTKTDKDGNETLDYGSHDFHIEDDKFNDGEGRIMYDEKCIGIIPETNNLTVQNNEAGHAVLSCDAFLYRDYGGYVCDILEERGGETSVSAELDCSEMSYNAKDKIYDVGLCMAYGVTLLGADVDPAIPSAKAVMFSSKEDDRQKQLLCIMQELKESLDNYTQAVSSAQNLGKEEIQMNHFEELLAKYNLKAEEIPFDHENMSDEELDAAFEELAKTSEEEPETESEVEPETEDLAVEENSQTVELSAKIGEKVITLSKSLTDVIYALTDLVNNTYASDGDYYSVEVFDGTTSKDRYVIMSGWYNGKFYRQNYSQKDGAYILKGEREELFPQLLTQAELDQLNTTRNNFAALEEELNNVKAELAKHEAEPEKMEILQAVEYAQIADTKEYSELLENHFDITKEDLEAKLNQILLAQVKANAVALAAKKDNDAIKSFPTGGTERNGRYGGIFANEQI